MGFDFDAYKGGAGGFITAEEKQVIAENGIPFQVVGVREVKKFDGTFYEVDVMLPDPETGDEEERIFSFKIGSGAESRDEMLAGLKAFLATDNPDPVFAKVEKVGRGFYLRAAE